MASEKDTPIPIRPTPALPHELERIRSEFKFYSPARKPYETAPAPKAGEAWRLERTLPSALYLGINWTRLEEAYGLSRFLLMKTPLKPLLRWTPDRFDRPEYDFRKLQYNPEKHLDEYPLLYINRSGWKTYSAAWHPTKRWLVTAGNGNYAKLWNVEDGRLITEHLLWDTNPDGTTNNDGGTLVWAPDGEMFISAVNSYDGRTGNHLTLNLLKDTSRYSNQDYAYLRGGGEPVDSYVASPHSADSNFSPWRPHSEQVTEGRGEKNITLRNGRTGEVERVISCDVPSKVRDFAWHPRGRYLAVTFEGHNVRILDVEGAKIIDDLSVQHLVGWNPDGKILVARREQWRDDFVVWDALETREKPMPGEMRSEPWFRRFFENISADGQRYVRHDKDYNYAASIYAVSTGELLAALPEPVTSAAWSPVDGGLLATCGEGETRIWRI